MSYTTFDLCARVAGVCVAAEMKVGVTHIGTLSVWLAWLWDSVMDINSELSTQASSVLTECLRWHFMCLICKVRGTVFAFRSTLLAYLWTDISRKLLTTHCTSAQWYPRSGDIKSLHPISHKCCQEAAGYAQPAQINETVSGNIWNRRAFNTVRTSFCQTPMWEY